LEVDQHKTDPQWMSARSHTCCLQHLKCCYTAAVSTLQPEDRIHVQQNEQVNYILFYKEKVKGVRSKENTIEIDVSNCFIDIKFAVHADF
jgi:hypothetical protein